LASNAIMGQKFLKYDRLLELAIIIILSNVGHEKIFSIVNFMTYKFCNHLIIHLDFMVKMHAKNFTSLKLSYELHNNLGMGSKEKLH